MFTLIGRTRRIEPRSECQYRLAVQPSHQRKQRRTVDPTRKEHPIRHVAALMQIDAFLQRAIQPFQRRILIDIFRPTFRHMRYAPSIQHVPLGTGQRLAGQQPLDAVEYRLCAGGELQLQQFLARRGTHLPRHKSSLQKCLRLRSKCQSAIDLRQIERLDPERIARQRHRALRPFMDRDRIHAT